MQQPEEAQKLPYPLDYLAASILGSKLDDHASCEKRLRKASRNPTVHFMIEQMERIGCKMPSEGLVACTTCEGQENVTGGFLGRQAGVDGPYTPRIEMCEGVQLPQKRFDEMLVHELIHAYDQCARHVHWESPLHQACSEVRAASLSGECSYTREAVRGHTSLQGRHQQCVKRRAGLSVAMRHGEDVAKAAVDQVFDRCYRDTMPFERHPAVRRSRSARGGAVRRGPARERSC